MSPRHTLNMTMGATATLLVVSAGIVFFTLGDQDSGKAQADLAARQQVLIQELSSEVTAFADADELSTAKQARVRLGRTIYQFDQALSGLVHGGSVELENGKKVEMEPVSEAAAREELRTATELWLKIGPPLADLAAGEFSVFSAAGQQAMKGLDANRTSLNESMEAVATALESGLATSSRLATYSRWATGILAGLLTLLAMARLAKTKKQPPTPAPERKMAPEVSVGPGLMTDFDMPQQEPVFSPPVRPEPVVETFTSPVDFDTVSASVDQMSVDMNTVASSTEKMRLAIDSVGHALQGMLYSLQEMSEDTAEGHRIVTNASNAAHFTSDTANHLSQSAQEMSRVVSQVTQLALKTREIAAQIETEAVATERSGEGLNSVVATEVRGLAHQTSTATLEIDQTVSTVLSTARQYEEAIGQILKNVAAIDRVTQGMEPSLLDLPARPAAPSLQERSEPVPLNPSASLASHPADLVDSGEPVESELEMLTAQLEELEDPVLEEPTPEEVVEETNAAIEEAAEEVDEKPSLQKAFRLPEVEDPDESVSEPEAEDPEEEAVFMLGKDALAEQEEEAVEESAEPAPELEEPVAAEEPEVEEVPPVESNEDADSHVFMLKKSDVHKMDPETEAAEEVAEEPEAPVVLEKEPDVEEIPEDFPSDQTVFILNKPKQTV